MAGKAVLGQIPVLVDPGNIIGGSSADKEVIDILVTAPGQILQPFGADDGGIILAARRIRGDGNIKIVFYGRNLNHSRKLLGNRVFLFDPERVKIRLNDG